MQLPNSFSDFLADIRPSDEQLKEYQEGHKTLRQRMHGDEEISKLLVSDFLQGSYRRSTAIQPQNGQKSDVDIVVVTNLAETPDVDGIATRFEDFLNRYDEYKGNHKRKSHSIGISLEEIELDLVITSAPSETLDDALKEESERTAEILSKSFQASTFLEPIPFEFRNVRTSSGEDWRAEPLRVPNYDEALLDDERWSSTDPLTQISWTVDKNAFCNRHYVNVVKALKWWRRTKCATSKYPKGYPIEHIIGSYCPDDIDSVATGVVRSLEAIRDCPDLNLHVEAGTTPVLPDRGIPENNVWKRVTPDQFATFMDQVTTAASIARNAYNLTTMKASAKRWHDLFGDPFPYDEDDGGSRISFIPPTAPADPSSKRYG
jgi:hypothetical protein